MKIFLIDQHQFVKVAPLGFSWTTLFFGFWVPLFRKDWLGFLVMFIGMPLFTIITFGYGGLLWFVIPFLYNKNYVNRLLKQGYQPQSIHDQTVMHYHHIAY